MNVLVLGGTKYFGKRLVSLLLEKRYKVTLATRGNAGDSFGDRVQRCRLDREARQSLQALAESGNWDIVFDQICYSSSEALNSCEVFAGRVGKYIHTSTGSVYVTDGERSEKDFDPFHYPVRIGSQADFEYGEGKRQAEAVFFQLAQFPVAAMRIPIVLGPDDYTGRLEFHIDHIREGRPIVISNLNSETCFINSSEAARFLLWLAEGTATGPLNACSDGRISIRKIIETIEEKLGRKAEVVKQGLAVDASPFVGSTSRFNNNSYAESLGFQFESLNSWFPNLVTELIDKANIGA